MSGFGGRGVDEKGFLRWLLGELGVEEDDVAYVDGLVVKVDGAAASTSRLPFQTWADFGWRNVAAAYSDVRVKFAEARLLLASVTAPDLGTAAEVVQGVREASQFFSLAYVGGDLNEGRDVVVDVVLVGWARARVGRAPRPGDVLVTIPQFGYTSLAYRFWQMGGAVVERGVEALKRPKPLWPLPPAECVTAAMDSSDGLGDVLWSMARGVDIVVKELPAPREVLEFAAERGLDVGEIVFNGGEEFLPVFAVRRDCPVESPYVSFAEVVPGEGRVWWRGEELKWRGWAYFRGWG